MYNRAIIPEDSSDDTARHDMSPADALASVREFKGPILLDLDETLYLRNSTEDFIDTAWPKVIAFPVLRLVEVLKPWRWRGGEAARDNWRIAVILCLFPWTLILWKRRVAALCAQFANSDLVEEAQLRKDVVVIATAGFRPVVTPLVAVLGFADRPLTAARPFVFADRQMGKLAVAIRDIGEECVARSLVVTDSLDDLPILDRAALGARTIWPNAYFRPAFSSMYYPGRYLSSVKRPGSHYIRHCILQDDLAIWILCSVALASAPFSLLLGLVLLLVSFWSVYEQGYVDNDLVGAMHEDDPCLSSAFRKSELACRRPEPWLWAAICGMLGLTFALPPGSSLLSSAIVWFATLAATFLCFLLFNRLDKTTRVWPFAVLQFARGAAFAAVVPVVPIAAAAIGAYVMEKWVPYFIYRLPKQPSESATPAAASADWSLPLNSIRLLFFMLLSITIALVTSFEVLFTWPAFAILALFLFKARRELPALISGARRIDRKI